MVLRLNSGAIPVAAPLLNREGTSRPPPGPDGEDKIVRAFQGGMSSLTDPVFLLPLLAAQGAFGLSRQGFLRLMPQGAAKAGALLEANLGAFGVEGLAFVGSARGLQHAMGREVVTGTSFAKELGHAYLTMGLLKAFGGLTKAGLQLRYQNIPAPLLSLQDKVVLKTAPQAAQFAGIYLSHTLAPGMGLGSYVDPAERAIQSAVTLVHFGAAGHILNRIPGYAAAGRNTQLETKRFIQEHWNPWKGPTIFSSPALAAPGIGAMSLPPVRVSPLFGNEILMNASKKDGAGRGEGRPGKPDSGEDTHSGSETTLVRQPSRRDHSYMDLELSDFAEMETVPDTLLGQNIDGRYQVESLLGEGGMGKVYKAHHMHLDKKIAIKVLRTDLSRRADMNKRFVNEAKAASIIDNPHVVNVSDFGVLPNGSTFFVMEYLEGHSLSTLTDRREPVPLPQFLNISLQMAEGMAAAHEVNIIHRDLKPDNIFLSRRGSDPEFVKILDFGIAKVPATTKLTIPGQVFGTPHYLSPEQAIGQKVDQRSDIYSMGIILYEMATGKVPFDSDSDNYGQILNMHITQKPQPPHLVVADPQAIPPGLEAIILKCLEKAPEERYQNMNELRSDLLMLQQGLMPVASQSKFPIKIKDWRVWAGAVGALAAGGLAFAMLRRDPDSEGETSVQPVVPPVPKEKPPAKAPPVRPEPPQEPPTLTTQEVKLSVQPLDAHVFMEGEDLGEGQVSLEMVPGDKVELEVRRHGYKSETITVDVSKPEVSVQLKPLRPSAPPAPKPAPARKPTPRAVHPTPPAPAPAPKPAKEDKPASSGPSGLRTITPW